MAVCTFCRKDIDQGLGTMLIKNDGTVLHFCSRKCEKNALVLRRNARKLKWTKRYEKGGIQK